MTRTEEILIRLGLDHKEVTRGLGLVKSNVNEFARNIRGTLSTAIGGYFAVEGIKDIVAWGEKISDTAKRLAVSTEAVQVWDYALRKNGESVESMTSFMEKMSVARSKALGGTDEAGKFIAAFDKFKISMSDLETIPLEQIAEKISKVYSAGGDTKDLFPSLKTIGGKGAGSVVDSLVDGLEESKKKARELGLIMSDDVVAKLKQASDHTVEFTTQLKSAFAGPIVFFLRLFQSVFEIAAAHVKSMVNDVATITGILKNPFNKEHDKFMLQFGFENNVKITEDLKKKLAQIWSTPEPGKQKFKGEEEADESKGDAERIAALKEETAKMENDAAEKKKSLQDQLNDLKDHEAEVQAALALAAGDELAMAEEANELAKTHLDIATKEKEIKEAQFELDQKKKEMADEQKRYDLAQNVYASAEQVAKSGQWIKQNWGGDGRWHWQQGPFAGIQQQIDRLTGDEVQARLFGQGDESVWGKGGSDRVKWDRSERLRLKGLLEKSGVTTPEDNLEKMKEHLATLASAIENAEMKIVPKMVE